MATKLKVGKKNKILVKVVFKYSKHLTKIITP